MQVNGNVARYNSSNEDNFTQAGLFWRNVLKEGEKERLVENIGNDLSKAQKFLQERAIKNFAAADPEYGRRIQKAIRRMARQQEATRGGGNSVFHFHSNP